MLGSTPQVKQSDPDICQQIDLNQIRQIHNNTFYQPKRTATQPVYQSQTLITQQPLQDSLYSGEHEAVLYDEAAQMPQNKLRNNLG